MQHVNPKLAQKIAKKNAKKRPEGDSWMIYRRLLGYGKPYWLMFSFAVVANICYSGVDSIFAYLLKPLINKGFVAPEPSFLKIIPILVIVLFVFRSIANLAGNYYMAWVGRKVIMRFRQEIFEHLLHLPCRFYDNSSSGQLLSMIVYNSAQVAAACTDALTTLVQSGCLAIGLLIVMFSISWQLTLLFFVTVPIIALTIKLSGRRLRNLNHNVQDAMGNIAHTAEEAIEGYKVIRMFGGEIYEKQKFAESVQRNFRRELKVVVTKAISVSGVQLVAVCGLAGMIFLGTSQSMHSHLTAGGFTALMAAMMALLRPMKNLTTVNATIQRGLAGAESVFKLLDEAKEKDTGSLNVDRVSGAIEYKNVSFNYGVTDKKTLDNLNFTVKAGTTVALVGRSGGGKSTLVNVLPRFYDIDQGLITIDGHDVFDYQLKSLRRQFAIVSQQVILFNDTIAKNIAYGKLGVSANEEKIRDAAIAAHAMEFIEGLPDGLNTMVGENGILLSGGQRQRIAIARAILKDAPILILDEATSALDTESERHIQAALEAVMRNRTTLVIAHRLSTIENADKIIVLDKGKVVEQGEHQELLRKGGFYEKLHGLQFNDSQSTILQP